MIVTRLVGGLGNQLFQFAAGRSLAARLGVELVLDSTWIEGEGGAGPGTARRYCLDGFDLAFELTRADRVAVPPARTRLGFHLRRWTPSRKPRLTALVEEISNGLDLRVLAAPDNTQLLGFWESERFFGDHADLIRGDLRFGELAPELHVLADELGTEGTVSLHVRRGDKVDVPTASGKYASLAPSWYATALEEISRRNGSIGTVYVFSDDPEWCRSNLAPAYPTVVVEGNSAHDDLHLMSLCRHHVIANSTFSWWAAWLDPRADKIVIAPATWRRDRTKPDAVPPGWIQIEN